jgi:IS1 family transposase
MKNFYEPKNSRSTIFSTNEAAIAFIEEHGLLVDNKVCQKCSSEMVKHHDVSYCSNFRLRCTNSSCNKSVTIFEGLKISTPRIDICEYFYIIYSWLEKNYEYNINKNTKVSLNSIKRIKRLILEVITEDNKTTWEKLGPNNPVQVDESVINRGKLIKSPSEMFDSVKRAVWIVGAVEENTRKIVLKVVPNRKKETFLNFFRENINSNSVIKTDGHRSYPYAVAGINGIHKIINHEEGFKNSDGDHTNLIECEWSQFKSDIKTRKGIPGFAMPGYIEEYVWRRRNLVSRDSDAYRLAFLKILTLLFEKK